MTIGVRRSTQQDVNPGHTPLDDDKFTRASSPEQNFINKTGRLEKATDSNLGPGSYTDVKFSLDN